MTRDNDDPERRRKRREGVITGTVTGSVLVVGSSSSSSKQNRQTDRGQAPKFGTMGSITIVSKYKKLQEEENKGLFVNWLGELMMFTNKTYLRN